MPLEERGARRKKREEASGDVDAASAASERERSFRIVQQGSREVFSELIPVASKPITNKQDCPNVSPDDFLKGNFEQRKDGNLRVCEMQS